MGCVIKYKGQSIPEEQFLQYLNKQIAINNLFNENESLANTVYKALGFNNSLSLEEVLKEYSIEDLKGGVTLRSLQNKIEEKDFETIKLAYNYLKSEEKYKSIKNSNEQIESKLQELRKELKRTEETKIGSVLTITNDENASDYKVKVIEINKHSDYAILKVKTAKNKEYTIRVESDGSTKTGYIEDFVFNSVNVENAENIKSDISNLKSQLQELKSDYSDYYVNYFENTNQITPQQKATAQQWYSQYLESLNKPNTNPVLQGNQKPDVLLPIGTSGSGKSTFIKSLPQENLVVIEPDAMRVEFTGDMNNKSKDKEIYEEAAKRAIAAINGKETPSQVYSKLGNKTKTPNIVIQSVYQTAGVQYAKSIGGVFSLRVNGTDSQFGNPFSNVESEIQKGLIRTKSTKESVEKYIEWILSPTTTIKPEQHKFIREVLQSGKLKGKPIVYYKELGEPSHATALDYLINKYDWSEKPKQVVFDTTNLTKDKRLPFIEAIKKAIPTANIQYKLMELNPELAKQRIKAQLARGENRANVSDETIDRHATSYKQMLEDVKNEPITKYKELGSKQDIEGFKKYVNKNNPIQQTITDLFNDLEIKKC